MGKTKTANKNHRRIEKREYFLITDIEWLDERKEWINLHAVGMVHSRRIVDGMETTEKRYFISSITDIELFSKAVRQHWGIENSLHWCLDVCLDEDHCRMRADNSAENFAVLRHIAVNLYRSFSSVKLSLKAKRFRCSLWVSITASRPPGTKNRIIEWSNTMSRRKIAEQILRHEKPGKVAFSCGGGIMWGCEKNGLTVADLANMPDAGAKFLVDMFRSMGSDFMFVGSSACFIPQTAMGGEANYNLASPELTKIPLDSVEDIDKFNADEVIATMRKDPMYHRMLEQVRNARELAQGDEIICIGPSAPFTAAGQLLGVEKLMEALFDDEDGYVEKIMRFWNRIAVAYTKDMLDAGGEMVYMWDPIASGDLISPAMYEEFVIPALTDLIKELHAMCPYVAMHICGNTTTRPGYIAQMGIDAFSVGDIDMVKASQDAQGKVVMLGNLNPATTLIQKNADEIYEMSVNLCRSMSGLGGFILAPGCDLSPMIPLENIQVMARAVSDYNAALN